MKLREDKLRNIQRIKHIFKNHYTFHSIPSIIHNLFTRDLMKKMTVLPTSTPAPAAPAATPTSSSMWYQPKASHIPAINVSEKKEAPISHSSDSVNESDRQILNSDIKWDAASGKDDCKCGEEGMCTQMMKTDCDGQAPMFTVQMPASDHQAFEVCVRIRPTLPPAVPNPKAVTSLESCLQAHQNTADELARKIEECGGYAKVFPQWTLQWLRTPKFDPWSMRISRPKFVEAFPLMLDAGMDVQGLEWILYNNHHLQNGAVLCMLWWQTLKRPQSMREKCVTRFLTRRFSIGCGCTQVALLESANENISFSLLNMPANTLSCLQLSVLHNIRLLDDWMINECEEEPPTVSRAILINLWEEIADRSLNVIGCFMNYLLKDQLYVLEISPIIFYLIAQQQKKVVNKPEKCADLLDFCKLVIHMCTNKEKTINFPDQHRVQMDFIKEWLGFHFGTAMTDIFVEVDA